MSTTFENVSGYENSKSNDAREYGVGVYYVPEAEQKVIEIAKISSELESTYEVFDPNKEYYVFCGDDRPLTTDNLNGLAQEGYADADNAVRTFGGAFGQSRAVAVAMAADGGESGLLSYRGNFVGFTAETAKNVATKSNLVPGIHSANSNEGNTEHLDPASEKGLGCAYAAGAEAVTELNTNPDVVEFASRIVEMLGSSAHYMESLVVANKKIKAIFSVEGQKTYNMNRNDASLLNLPTAIVIGNHAPVKQARIVINLGADLVSNPRKALEIDMPTYNSDIVIECIALLKAYPNLDPRILLESKVLDICATAEALASSEGLHAWDFEYERIGNFEDAVSILEETKRETLAA
jgi:hypothetical protein